MQKLKFLVKSIKKLIYMIIFLVVLFIFINRIRKAIMYVVIRVGILEIIFKRTSLQFILIYSNE